jgi:competence protein ComEC
MRRLMPIILLAAALGLGVRFGWKQPTEPLGPSVCVDFIDVGQGDSILIRTPDGASALIDAGEEDSGPKVVDYLKRARIKKLDLVVMSHPHSDHIGGIPAVLEAFHVGGVLDSGYVHGSAIQERVLEIIEDTRIPYHRALRGTEFRLGKDVRLEVLAPGRQLAHGTESDANNNSVVVRLVYRQVRMLFPGDVEWEGEGKLIESRMDIKSQVLKVAHHGASDSTSLEFIRLVGPETVVISVGAGNEYGHPRKSTLRRLAKERTGASLFRTDRDGAVTIRTDGNRIVVETRK